MSEPRANAPFRRKLTVIVALVAAVPLVFVGLALIDINADTLQTQSREFQLAVADDVARAIEAELVEAQDGLHAVGSLLTDRTLQGPVAVRLATTFVGSMEAIDHAAIYDADGTLIDAIREEGTASIEIPGSLPAEIRQQANAQQVALGAVDAAASGVRALLAVPLFVEDTITGYAASKVSLHAVQQRVERLAELRFENLEGSLFVVASDGRILAHPDRARVLGSAADHPLLKHLSPHVASGRLLQSGEFDQKGERFVGTAVGVPGRTWAIVTQVPVRIAYGSLSAMRALVIGTVGVTLLLAVAVGFGLARRITRPIGQLVEFARRLSERDFDTRVNIDTSDELAVLGSTMNQAASELAASEVRIRKEEAIRADLGRYLPDKLVSQVVERSQDMQLGGVRRNVTVLFADVVAFTPLAERQSPETVVLLLNEFFTVLTLVVFKHGGTVDKFIGDCLMAMWGAPEPTDDHARRAVAAAEDMLLWLEAANASWKERFDIEIEVAIGINTGEAVVGNVGSEQRMQYTAIGDVVNMAARMEALARPQQILIAEATRAALGDDVECGDLGEQRMPGRMSVTQLYEVRS